MCLTKRSHTTLTSCHGCLGHGIARSTTLHEYGYKIELLIHEKPSNYYWYHYIYPRNRTEAKNRLFVDFCGCFADCMVNSGQLRCILPQSNTCAWVCACDANREPQWLHWSYFDDPRVKAWFMGEFWVPRRLDMVGANFQWNLQWRGKFSARKKTLKICPDSEDFAENFVTRWQRLTNHFTRHVAQIFSEIFSGIFDYPYWPRSCGSVAFIGKFCVVRNQNPQNLLNGQKQKVRHGRYAKRGGTRMDRWIYIDRVNFSCEDVILCVERPDESDSDAIQKFMDELFEPPFDNPWKQRQ